MEESGEIKNGAGAEPLARFFLDGSKRKRAFGFVDVFENLRLFSGE